MRVPDCKTPSESHHRANSPRARRKWLRVPLPSCLQFFLLQPNLGSTRWIRLFLEWPIVSIDDAVFPVTVLRTPDGAVHILSAAPLDLNLDRRVVDLKVVAQHLGHRPLNLLSFSGALRSYKNVTTARHTP